jgi:molybdenum storage protein
VLRENEVLPRIGANELRDLKLPGLPIDALVLELLGRAKHIRQVQVVNGLAKGTITRALAGEHIGTIIHAD